jgi:formylglycine-generating enzyme required for sulfatase activity
MSKTFCGCWLGLLLMVGLVGYQREGTSNGLFASDGQRQAPADSFPGSQAGDAREVAGIKLCWCPPGEFRMGSPPGEPERRPDEGQVEVTLTRGFWMGKYEVTQGQWKLVIGKLPGELTVAGARGTTYLFTTSTTPRRKPSVAS